MFVLREPATDLRELRIQVKRFVAHDQELGGKKVREPDGGRSPGCQSDLFRDLVDCFEPLYFQPLSGKQISGQPPESQFVGMNPVGLKRNVFAIHPRRKHRKVVHEWQLTRGRDLADGLRHSPLRVIASGLRVDARLAGSGRSLREFVVGRRRAQDDFGPQRLNAVQKFAVARFERDGDRLNALQFSSLVLGTFPEDRRAGVVHAKADDDMRRLEGRKPRIEVEMGGSDAAAGNPYVEKAHIAVRKHLHVVHGHPRNGYAVLRNGVAEKDNARTFRKRLNYTCALSTPASTRRRGHRRNREDRTCRDRHHHQTSLCELALNA